jgi:hypothetical protein
MGSAASSGRHQASSLESISTNVIKVAKSTNYYQIYKHLLQFFLSLVAAIF